MSRIGRMPVEIPSGVKTQFKNNVINIEGPLGKLAQTIDPNINIKTENNNILVTRKGESSQEKSLHGLYQRLITNMVLGVTKGFQKNLEIHGVGYRAKIEGKSLMLQIGFSHPVKFTPPDGIKITVSENTKINISGIDKQLVGEVAAKIRRYYPPEPYKGKGIRYTGEYVRRKAGKAAIAKGGSK